MYSCWDFKEVFENGSVDVIQSDLSHAGGITEGKKIVAMAEAYDVAMAPTARSGRSRSRRVCRSTPARTTR